MDFRMKQKNVHQLEVIYQTQRRVFYQISKHWEVGWKNEAQPSFFKPTFFSQKNIKDDLPYIPTICFFSKKKKCH